MNNFFTAIEPSYIGVADEELNYPEKISRKGKVLGQGSNNNLVEKDTRISNIVIHK